LEIHFSSYAQILTGQFAGSREKAATDRLREKDSQVAK
jgi:hypothetical protein